MTDWTSGYRADIDYTHGYYRELSTGLIDFALLQRGFEPPVREGPARYLELGYGQGVTLNIQAAACPGEYWGTDFNPVHAGHAQTLARASRADLRLFDDSFAELAAREDLPKFDYIVLHGIWTWVSDENRRVLVDILRRRLKVGGAVYFSYNCLPGWAVAMPLRHLLSIHVEAAGERANMNSRIEEALAFAGKLAAEGGYFATNPVAKARLEGLANQNRNYLAHEYLNGVWTPMYFSQIQEWLSDAKLSFAAAGAPMDNLDGFVLTPAQREILGGLDSDTLREGVRDYLLNTQFRRDLYVRGARRLAASERQARLMDQRLVLLAEPDNILREVQINQNKIEFNRAIYDPVIEALAGAGPQRLSDLAALPKVAALGLPALLEVAQVLVGTGQAAPAQAAAEIEAATAPSQRLNAALCARADTSGEIAALASPVIGGGIPVARFEQMFLAARAAGPKTVQDMARHAWSAISAQGQTLVQEGKTLEGEAENLAELTRQAEVFDTTRMPLLKRLGVV